MTNRVAPTKEQSSDSRRQRDGKRKQNKKTTQRAHTIEASCLIMLAIMLLCVSMPHLASGIQRITQSSIVTAWLMAIVFDLAQVVCEVALLLIPILGIKRRIGPACKAVIISCTVMSMVLNVDAFLQHAEGWKGCILATVWGTLLPLGVLTLFYVGSAFIIDQE